MRWYEEHHVIDDIPVSVYGDFECSQLKIYVVLDFPEETKHHLFYDKTITIWVHQDILAEDILAKYEGQIKKCEKKLPLIVEKLKLDKCI